MAAITAANITPVSRTNSGGLYHLVYKVKGDGSGTSIVVGLSRIIGHAVGDIDETAGYNPKIAYTNAAGGAKVTYATAPTINKYHFLHLWGF